MVSMNALAKRRSWSDVAVFEDVNAGKAVETFLTEKGFAARAYDDKMFRHFFFCVPRA